MKIPCEFPELTAAEIIVRLENLQSRSGVGSGGLVFDADGTLWAGDAGEEAFQHALDLDLIREEAAPALRQEAEEVGLSTAGTPSQLARRLLQAFQSGSYPELRACEMMVWCYAGLTEGMLREHARQAFARTTSNVKLYPPLLPLIEWARQRQLRCIIVSASPKLVVEEAVRGLGFDESDVAAARAVVQADILQPVLAEPVPYCASKVSAGVKLLQGSPWLATFGDNAFDLDMLQAAALAVAVRPKQRLLQVLGQVKGASVFREP